MINVRVTITSALPYVNGVKHLGNVVGSLLPADIFHRFLDLLGIENIYICGTDDHGTAVEISAAEEHLPPKKYADKYYKKQKEIYEKWNFDFTNFGRTSKKIHHDTTQELFLAAHKNGFIEEKEITLPYCESCERFLPDRYIIGTCPKCDYESARGDQCEKCSTLLEPQNLVNPRCTICSGPKIIFKKEKHIFLSLDKIQPELEKWISGNKHWPTNTLNLASGWLKEGLKPRCISRNLEWGVPVPLKGYENLVFYVWYDAPIGYISITKEKFEDWKKWWVNAKIYHFIGKDNIPFHTIFWPSILIAGKTKISLPYFVAGYEYLNWVGEKFSTSKGIGLFSDEALSLFDADYWRFYLTRILPESKDANFDWDDFQSRVNNELIANIGNLFYRATSFIEKNFNGKVPAGFPEKKLERKLNESLAKIEKLVWNVKLKEALNEILSLSSEVNKYFQEKKPWSSPDAENTLYNAINVVAKIIQLLHPIVPKSSEKALKLLNIKKEPWKKMNAFTIKPGHKIKSEILFKKIEDDEIKKAKHYKTKYAKKSFAEKGTDEIKNIFNIRTATIISAENHPNADKLYVLKVDLGGEKRQLVAGLRDIYSSEELLGKQVLVLTNLKSAVLRSVRSEGMLLACDNGVLLAPEKRVDNGLSVTKAEREITIEDFAKQKFVVGKGQHVFLNNEELKTNNVYIKPEKNVKEGMKIR